MSEYIPLEIQEQILKRLPLKPLIQFRTVSKSYKCLIDSQDFIVSYYVHHQPLQPNDRFILRYTLSWLSHYPPCEDRYISLIDNDDNGFVQQEFIPPVPDIIKTLGKTVDPLFESLVGSSHGLLCFNGQRPEMVALWNPSIRKSISIQVPYMSHKPSENFCYLNVDNVFGFGVCPVTFDPTVVKITCIDYKRNRNDIKRTSLPWKVGVFTLSTGTWSILSTNLPGDSIRVRRDQVVIDKFIYWAAQDVIDAEDYIYTEGALPQSRFLIVSFDLTAKEFKEISLTGSLTNRRSKIQSISKLRESLVLLVYHFEEDVPACWCLWMMNEEGVSRSFTKLYTINLPHTSISKILGFRKTGELIMQTSPESEPTTDVQIYEPNNGNAENLGIDENSFSFFMCSYMETLLLLDKSDGYMYLPIVRI